MSLDEALSPLVYDLKRKDVNSLIKKTRKIVKKFRKSEIMNEALMKEAKKNLGKEKRLVLDVKTRWNSTLFMIESVVELKDSLQTVLASVSPMLVFSPDELILLDTLKSILKPITVAQQALCRQDANLLVAEGAYKYLFEKLSSIDHPLAIELYASIKARFIERRPKTLVTLLTYLNNPESINNKDPDVIFTWASKKEITNLAKNLMKRLFEKDECILQEPCNLPSEEPTIDMSTELEVFIQAATKVNHGVETNKDFKSMSEEMKSFERSGDLTTNLSLLFYALKSIPPSSVDSERAFSTTSAFLSHLRSNMSDKFLDDLLFLNGFFKNERQ